MSLIPQTCPLAVWLAQVPPGANPGDTTASKRTKAALKNAPSPIKDHDCASLEIHTGAARGGDSESGDTDRTTCLDNLTQTALEFLCHEVYTVESEFGADESPCAEPGL